MNTSKFEELPSPVKGENDKKNYKTIKLQNGLVALLISDTNQANGANQESNVTSNEKKAAACLAVGVGSFSDPKEVPGMAHFLEHMVSMGSEKYPKENDLESFITKCGGSTNAGTDSESTGFYLTCSEIHLHEALDKFAQFFINPLMKKDALIREREAVDSEFQMNAIPSDAARKEALLFTFAKPNSPMNFFSWGNLKTLKNNITDDELYQKLHDFRRRHYSAHRMTLAIQACLPLETLQSFVVDLFSNVPNNNLAKLDFSDYAKGIFDTPQFNRIYYMKPVQEIIELELTWSMPSLQNKYKNKALTYISNLIGNEGSSSLLAYLKKHLWATSVMCGNDKSQNDENSLFTHFFIQINLTEEGLKQLYEVIEAVFSFIKLVKTDGIHKRIFDELQMVTDAQLRFASEETAEDVVQMLSSHMQIYPCQDYILGGSRLYEYDENLIRMVLNSLLPDNVNILVATKKLPEGLKFDQVEHWFGTEYTGIDIPQEIKNRWTQVQPYQEFQIALPNPYLSNNFIILPEISNHPDYPQKIINTPKCELWYRKDQKFKLPNAHYNLYVINSTYLESAKSSSLLDMFLNLLVFYVEEEAYPATLANLEYKFVSNQKGIVFNVSGFHEKIPVLIEVGAKYMGNLKDYINEKTFEEVKNTVIKDYNNKFLSPSYLATDVHLKLKVNHWTALDKYNALLKITYNDMKQYLEDYKKKLYVTALVQGNVLPEVAIKTINKFVETLQFDPLPKENFPKYEVRQLPIGEKCLILHSFNKDDSNSITANYYEIGPYTIKNFAMLVTILTILEEPLFDILRTKEQLGYDVSTGAKDIFGFLEYSIEVHSQATKFTTAYLDARIEESLKRTQKILEDMTEEEFEKVKENIIKMKKEADIQLKEEVDRNWTEIVGEYYLFDRTKQEIQMFKDMKLQEVKTWWKQFNSFGGKENFRKVSIQVEGHIPDSADMSIENEGEEIKWKVLKNNVDDEHNTNKSNYYIENVDDFRLTLSPQPQNPILKQN